MGDSCPSHILFEITDKHLETGLRGFPVGYCPTSYLDSYQGLFYSDLPISSLIKTPIHDVIYLLRYGHLPTTDESAFFVRDLSKRMVCSERLIEAIKSIPNHIDPMKMLSIALLFCSIYEGKKDYQEDCLNLIAKLPHLISIIIAHHSNWVLDTVDQQELVDTNGRFNYLDIFLKKLHIPNLNQPIFSNIFSHYFFLHLDHGGANLSSFVGKAVASGLEDLYGSLASSVNALAAPLHGRGNQEALLFLQKIQAMCKEDLSDTKITHCLEGFLTQRVSLPGFGHVVFKIEDPRASILYELAAKLFGDLPLCKIALKIRDLGVKELAKYPHQQDQYATVDAISGVLLYGSGFTYLQYYTLLFAFSRLIGIAIQIVYERCEAKGGKGTPIVRPKYLYRKRE